MKAVAESIPEMKKTKHGDDMVTVIRDCILKTNELMRQAFGDHKGYVMEAGTFTKMNAPGKDLEPPSFTSKNT